MVRRREQTTCCKAPSPWSKRPRLVTLVPHPAARCRRQAASEGKRPRLLRTACRPATSHACQAHRCLLRRAKLGVGIPRPKHPSRWTCPVPLACDVGGSGAAVGRAAVQRSGGIVHLACRRHRGFPQRPCTQPSAQLFDRDVETVGRPRQRAACCLSLASGERRHAAFSPVYPAGTPAPRRDLPERHLQAVFSPAYPTAVLLDVRPKAHARTTLAHLQNPIGPIR